MLGGARERVSVGKEEGGGWEGLGERREVGSKLRPLGALPVSHYALYFNPKLTFSKVIFMPKIDQKVISKTIVENKITFEINFGHRN